MLHATKHSTLTDEQIRSIGFFLVEWSNVEVLLKQVLCRLLCAPDFIGRTFTDGLSAASIDKKIREAIELHQHRYRGSLVSNPLILRTLALCNRANQARSLRNKFAHFCWTRSDDQTIFGLDFSGGPPDTAKHRRGMATIKLSELERYGKEAHLLVDELLSLLKDLPELAEDKEWADLVRRSHRGRR